MTGVHPPARPAPTTGADDELLSDIPARPVDGAWAGYRRSARLRRWIAGTLVVGTAAAVWGAHAYVERLEREAQRGVTPRYHPSARALDPRDRVLHWGSGAARLGLSRDPPGVNLIVLPDRELRLADGYHSAQIRVRVEDGRTVKLRVLTGKIDVVERPTGPNN